MTQQPSASASPAPRKRGAQPGNSNALKHGRYARKARPLDLQQVHDQLTEEFPQHFRLLAENFALAGRLAGRINNLPELRRLLYALAQSLIHLKALYDRHPALYLDPDLFLYDLNRALDPSQNRQTQPAAHLPEQSPVSGKQS